MAKKYYQFTFLGELPGKATPYFQHFKRWFYKTASSCINLAENKNTLDINT